MSNVIKPIITQIGQNAINAGDGIGRIRLTHIILGKEGWSPDKTATALKTAAADIVQIPIETFERINTSQIHVTAVEDGNKDYAIREIGFLADTDSASGIFFAVWSHATIPLAYKVAGTDVLFSFDLSFSVLADADVVTVDGTGTFTLPAATEDKRGMVELATQAEVSAGTDGQRVVTPAMLKHITNVGTLETLKVDGNVEVTGSITADAVSWENVSVDGSIGIDVSNPDGKLEIAGIDYANSGLLFKIGGSGGDVNHLSTNHDLILNSETGAFHFRKTTYDGLATQAEYVTIANNGNVGIGTTNPQIQLALGDSDTGLQQQGDGELAVYTNNAEKVRFNKSGNVGIGTTTPTQRLDVNGNTNITGSVMANSATISTNATINGNTFVSGKIGIGTTSPKIHLAIGDTDTGLQQQGDGELAVYTNNVERLRVNKDGNVGIGTISPAAKLDVAGDAKINGNTIITGNLTLPGGNNQIYTWSQGDNNWRIGLSNNPGFARALTTDYTQYITYNSEGIKGFAVGVNGGNSSFEVNGQHTAYFRGNVGIGTASPTAKLHVTGGSDAKTDTGGFLVLGDTTSINVVIDNNEIAARNNGDPAMLYVQQEGGTLAIGGQTTFAKGVAVTENLAVSSAVGIGTSAPEAPLHVIATANQTPVNNGIYVYNPTSSTGQDAIVAMRVNNANAGDPYISWDIAGVTGWSMGVDNSDGDKLKIGRAWNNITYNSPLVIDTAGNVGINTTNPKIHLAIGDSDTGLQQQGDGELAIYANNGERVRISKSGSVGIGTTTPGATLDVVGNAKISGDLTLTGGDNQIYTWGQGNKDWRIGFSQDPGFARALTTSFTQYVTYNIESNRGFAVGVNGGNSSFEVNGQHTAYFRGNVGIGTTTPQAPLHVNGGMRLEIGEGLELLNGDADYYGNNADARIIRMTDNNNPTVDGGITFEGLGTGSVEKILTIRGGGTVGIGTITPSATLDVVGTTELNGKVTVNGDIVLPGNDNHIYTWEDGNDAWRIGMSNAPGFNRALTTSYTQFVTYNNSSDKGFAVGVNGGNSSFEINGQHTAYFRGNVGIGTTAPNAALHVKGQSDGGAQLRIEPVAWAAAGDYGQLLLGTDNNHYIKGEHSVGMSFYDVDQFSFEGGDVSISNNLTVTGSIITDSIKASGSSVNWEIVSQGENLVIREPEASNEEWARFDDGDGLYLLAGMPNLYVNGSFKAAANTSGERTILLEGPSSGDHRNDSSRATATGLVYRVENNPASGEPIFQIRSSGQAVRFFADHDGWTGSTDNPAWFGYTGSRANYFAGQVGIGISSPNGLLELLGSSTKAQIKFGGTGGDAHHLTSARDMVFNTTNSAIRFRNVTNYNDLTNYTDLVTMLGNGDVGIGTNSPSYKLHIVDSSQEAGGGTLVLGPTSGSNLRLGYHNDYAWVQSHGGKPLAINPIGNNVGIGTTAPQAPLHVVATANQTPANNGIYVYNPTSSAGQDAIVAVRVEQAAAGDPYISWDIGGVTGWSMGIDNSDSDKLKIGRAWNNIAHNSPLVIDTSGNVGIGTNSPSRKLFVNGNAQITNGLIVTNGLTVDGEKISGSIFSDISLKDNITDSHGSLAQLQQLHLVNFDWKKDFVEKQIKIATQDTVDPDEKAAEEKQTREEYSRKQLGLIAQEVEKVFPHWVKEDGEGYKRLNLQELTMLLLGAVQELKAEKDTAIAALEARLQKLENAS